MVDISKWYLSSETSLLVIFGLNLDFETSKNYEKSHWDPQKLVLQAQFEKKKYFFDVKKALCSS